MSGPVAVKKTLGLTGVTVNAMALIAPGAFLWITFQLQASNKGGDTDMWTGIVAALIVAFLTAFSFSELGKSKITEAKGKCLQIADLIDKNPKGTGVRIFG